MGISEAASVTKVVDWMSRWVVAGTTRSTPTLESSLPSPVADQAMTMQVNFVAGTAKHVDGWRERDPKAAFFNFDHLGMMSVIIQGGRSAHAEFCRDRNQEG